MPPDGFAATLNPSRAPKARAVEPEAANIMRTHQAIAIVAVILLGFSVKQYFFSTSSADASTNAYRMSTLDYPDMKYLPLQQMHDMTFVFSDEQPVVTDTPVRVQKMHDMTFVFSDGD